MKFSHAAFFSLLLSVSFHVDLVFAQPVTSGNLVIFRVGDGSVALGTAAAPVFLDEYTPLGSLVRSIAIPSIGATALTATGNATTEGIMSFSQNGSTILFGGYRKDAGGANPSADAPATTPRVIGTFSPSSGLFSTTLALSDPTGTIRSVASTDGSSLFYVGTSVNVRYVGSPGPSATSVVIDARNSRQVLLEDNVLFASNGSTTIAGKVQHYGVLPTGATAATPIVNLATADAVNGMAFFDLSGSVAGMDTLYALSTVEGRLRKYSFDGSSWLDNGFIASTAQNLSGYTDGSSVSLFLTSGTTLSGLTDSSGYNATLSGSLTTLATAPANEAFRGVVATPEPSTLGLLGLGVAMIVCCRRRH